MEPVIFPELLSCAVDDMSVCCCVTSGGSISSGDSYHCHAKRSPQAVDDIEHGADTEAAMYSIRHSDTHIYAL